MAIASYLYDSTAADREIELEAEHIANLHDKQLLWVDVTAFDEKEIDFLKDLLNLKRDSVHFLVQDGVRPRLADYGHYRQLNVNALQKGKDGLELISVDFIISANLIVTVHRQPVEFLESFDQSLKSDTDLGLLNAESFLAGLLDWHLTGYFRVVENIEKEIDGLDAKALTVHRQPADLLADMSILRQRIALVRRALTPHREVYAGLLRNEFQERAQADLDMTFPILNERLETAIDSIENVRDLLIGSFDVFATRVTMKTNDVIKVLTLFSFVWLPASVVVGISALLMKTPVSPRENAGFWAMLSSMILIALGTVLFARRKKWL